MKLTEEQEQRFDWDGYLFFPSLFRHEEIKVLTDEVPALYAQRRPENVCEKTADLVRTNFAAHMYSYPFAKGLLNNNMYNMRIQRVLSLGAGQECVVPFRV